MRKTGMLSVFALLCISCTPPPFFESLARDAAIAAKMTKEATVKTTIERGESIDPETVFLPVKTPGGVDCSRGFIQNLESALFFTYSTIDGPATIRVEGVSFPHANPYPNKATSLFAPAKTGDYVFTFVIMPGNEPESKIRMHLANTAALPPQFTLVGSEPTFDTYIALRDAGVRYIMGVSVPPTPDPVQDICYMLYARSANAWGEIAATMSTAGLETPPNYLRSIQSFQLPMLDGLGSCRYFHDPYNGVMPSYACIPSMDGWKTCRWYGNSVIFGPDVLTGITSRIDAILSTGELFSTENGTGRVYLTADSGSERLRFPLGNLKFAYEAYVDGTPRMIFSLAFMVEKRVWFNVYSIPTAELSRLAAN